MKGLIIGFEGIDKCGKETQSKLLKQFLKKKKIKFVSGREPGGTSYGEIERRSLQDPKWIERVNKGYKGIAKRLSTKEQMCQAAEMFGYLKARAQFFALKVKPEVEKGKHYILDRTGYSTVAYQGFGLYKGKKRVVDLIIADNRFAMQELPIARIYLLDITVKEMLRRRGSNEFGTGLDRIEQRKKEFFENTRRGYLWLAKQNLKTFMVIDGTKSRKEISEIIRKDLLKLLKLE